MIRTSKVTKSATFALLASSFLCAVQAVSAMDLDKEHKIAQTADFGDGIKVSDYADGSGFEAVGGGGHFVYLADSKVLKYTDAAGETKTFVFDHN